VQRWLTIALIGLLALVWAGSPAFACARVAQRDCCTGMPDMPCGEESAGKAPTTLSMVCCAQAPATSSLVAAETHRSAQIQPADPESPDLHLVPVRFEAPANIDGPSPGSIRAREAMPRADASRTYLHTLRLRL
jgi:hypothetical protein